MDRFIDVEKLDISLLTAVSLKIAGIYTVADVKTKTDDELMKVRGMDRRTLERIRNAVKFV